MGIRTSRSTLSEIWSSKMMILKQEYTTNPNPVSCANYMKALTQTRNYKEVITVYIDAKKRNRSEQASSLFYQGLKGYSDNLKLLSAQNKLYTKLVLCLSLAIPIIYIYIKIKGKKRNPTKEEIKANLFPLAREMRVSPMNELPIKDRLSDVRGIDDITEEITHLVDMVKNNLNYKLRGASVPKGVLLYGKPGTGKTMIARAIAGEAGVRFFHYSGSNFDELYVGVGAARVREMFQEAKKNAPCIIFIDEIDALLTKQRRSALENSSNAATLNEFLSQLDGFESSQSILLIGATNDINTIDQAALRPGRFDSKIYVPLPDRRGREAIFSFYLSKIQVAPNIDKKMLSETTPGFSGADIRNMVNQAMIDAVNANKTVADIEDLEKARDKILMGLERKTLARPEKDILNSAICQTGHVLVCFYVRGPETIYKTTVAPRGTKLAGTYYIAQEKEEHSSTRSQLIDKITVLVAGHVAEKKFRGEKAVSTQSQEELKKATDLAYLISRKFGMGKASGLVSTTKSQMSEGINMEIDKEVKTILKEASEAAEKILDKHEAEFKLVAQNLYQYESLYGKDIKRIIKGKSLKRKPIKPYPITI